MLLSPEHEQQLIEDNMQKIYRAVDNYMMRCHSRVICIPYEDFVQEVAIVFLKYIRNCEKLEDTEKFPWYSAMEAMRKLVMELQPLRSHRRTQHFSDVIHSMPHTVPLDSLNATKCMEVDGMAKHWVDDKETQIDFEAFMDGQTENTRRIASMRVYGMTLKEIGDQCGVSKVAIKKRLDKLNIAYKEYMEDAKNAE